MRHGGSVMAPDALLATHYARELYGRRQESVRLWIVRRADIVDLDDPDLLQPPLDRSRSPAATSCATSWPPRARRPASPSRRHDRREPGPGRAADHGPGRAP